jgi:fatty-acid desaturase
MDIFEEIALIGLMTTQGPVQMWYRDQRAHYDKLPEPPMRNTALAWYTLLYETGLWEPYVMRLQRGITESDVESSISPKYK